MSKVFYLSEIVKFAIEKEIESEELYQKLAEKATKPDAKALFEFLLGEEKRHESIYKTMLTTVKEEQTPGIKDDSEYFDYMQEMINSSRVATSITSEQLNIPLIAVEFAIGREKDSVLFYVGLKNFVLDADKAKVDQIIKEEGHHIALLSKLKSVL